MFNPIEWLLGIPSQSQVDALISEWEAKTHHVPDDSDAESICLYCDEPIHHRPKYDFWQHSRKRIGIFCDTALKQGRGDIMVPGTATPVDQEEP